MLLRALNTRQRHFLEALLSMPTVKAAAKAAKVPYSTAKRWTALTHFAVAYLEARRRAFTHAQAMLQSAAGKAVRRLVKELGGEKASDRIRAALGILDSATKAAELTDIIDRLEALEQQREQDDAKATQPT